MCSQQSNFVHPCISWWPRKNRQPTKTEGKNEKQLTAVSTLNASSVGGVVGASNNGGGGVAMSFSGNARKFGRRRGILQLRACLREYEHVSRREKEGAISKAVADAEVQFSFQ